MTRGALIVIRILAFCVLWTLALVFLHPAQARWDPKYAASDPKIIEWFKQQHNSLGEWCCDESDGHEYYGDYTLNEDGSVTVMLDGAPHKIPAERVLKGANPTGHAVWWHLNVMGQHHDYCFAPGTLS